MTGDSKPGSTVQREWAAVEDEYIVDKADSKSALIRSLRKDGKSPDDYEIMALPKAHGSIFV